MDRGEESGGLTIRGHVPEKDGILACLLIAEMVACEGKFIKEILDDLYGMVGLFLSESINFIVIPLNPMESAQRSISPPN